MDNTKAEFGMALEIVQDSKAKHGYYMYVKLSILALAFNFTQTRLNTSLSQAIRWNTI